MLLPLAQRAPQDGRWRDCMRETKCCNIQWTLDPLSEPQSATSPLLRKTRQGCINLTKDASPNTYGYVLRARERWSGEFLIVDCENLENLSASDIQVKRCKRQEGADGSLQLFDLPQPPQCEETIGKKQRTPSLKKNIMKTCWSMSGDDFTYRHHEVHRSKLYVLDEPPSPFQ